jgi:hypothetical protein
MRPLDIAIAIATLDLNPDPTKSDALREEIRRALLRQEISPQSYAETLRLLSAASSRSPISSSDLSPP